MTSSLHSAGLRLRGRPNWLAFGVLLLLLLSALGPVRAGGGDDHSHGPEPAPQTASGIPRFATQTDLYQLVGTLKDKRLTLYVDRFADNEPVTDAKIMVTLGDQEVEATATDDGTYTVSSPVLSSHGPLELIFNVSSPHGDDLLNATLNRPEGASHPVVPPSRFELRKLVESAPPMTLATLGIFFAGIAFGSVFRTSRPKAIAFALGCVLILFAGGIAFAGGGDDHTHDPPPVLPGADTPQRMPDGFVFVPKVTQRLLEVRTRQTQPEPVVGAIRLIGKVIADPNRGGMVQSINGGRIIAPDGGMPTIGQQVRRGDVLAHVERPIIQADQATVLERMGDIEQQIALAEAKLARARRLVEGGAGTRVSVSDLEIELEGLRRRRRTVNDIRTQPEILRAPADGVIASSRVAAGQVVGAQDVLFQIVDPKSLWVEALSFEASAGALPGSTALTTDGDTLKLAPKGTSRALQQQATVVHYAIENPPASLRVGQPVTVLSPSGNNAEGIVLPRSSLVKASNGEAVVWRHVDPERFEPRPVRIEPLDATRIIVRAGIAEGDRIVVRGADLINQIR